MSVLRFDSEESVFIWLEQTWRLFDRSIRSLPWAGAQQDAAANP